MKVHQVHFSQLPIERDMDTLLHCDIGSSEIIWMDMIFNYFHMVFLYKYENLKKKKNFQEKNINENKDIF